MLVACMKSKGGLNVLVSTHAIYWTNNQQCQLQQLDRFILCVDYVKVHVNRLLGIYETEATDVMCYVKCVCINKIHNHTDQQGNKNTSKQITGKHQN